MGFSSIDALVTAITGGAKAMLPFSRVIYTGATSAAGRWHELLSNNATGTGGAMTLTGTAGTGIVCNGSTAGRLPINAAVSPLTRHLLGMSAVTSATTLTPAYLLLTDIIHIYPSLVVVTTPSTLSNHPTWTGTGDTRMTNANGVHASVLLTTASSAAGQLTLTYVNETGAAGKVAGTIHSPVAAHPAGALFGATPTTATPGGPFIPLAAGDLGVRQVTSYAINTGATGGTGCIILHRPIATIPLMAANMSSERDFLNQMPTLPRIYDDACLGMFVQVGNALTAGNVVVGELNYAWA